MNQKLSSKPLGTVIALIVAGGLLILAPAVQATIPDPEIDSHGEKHMQARHGGQDHGRIMGSLHESVHDALAQKLGIDKDELDDALTDGKSLADLAAENGVSPDELRQAVREAMNEKTDELIEEGDLGAEQADHLKARQAQHNEFHGGDASGSGHHGESHMQGRHGDQGHESPMESLRTNMHDALAEKLGISTDELRQAMQEVMNEKIDEIVEDGHLSAEHAGRLKAHQDQHSDVHGEHASGPGHRGMKDRGHHGAGFHGGGSQGHEIDH